MTRKRAIFLDRDGVINQPCEGKRGNRPPNTPEELQVYPGVAETIAKFNGLGFLVFVVTNQGGVGLGYMTEETLSRIHDKLENEVEKAGGHFTEIMACTHKPRANCSCRKPKPGMLLTLAQKYNVDLERSYMIGDRDMDIEAGKAASTTTILISTKGKIGHTPDHVSPNLSSAGKLIFKLEKALNNPIDNSILT